MPSTVLGPAYSGHCVRQPPVQCCPTEMHYDKLTNAIVHLPPVTVHVCTYICMEICSYVHLATYHIPNLWITVALIHQSPHCFQSSFVCCVVDRHQASLHRKVSVHKRVIKLQQ